MSADTLGYLIAGLEALRGFVVTSLVFMLIFFAFLSLTVVPPIIEAIATSGGAPPQILAFIAKKMLIVLSPCDVVPLILTLVLISLAGIAVFGYLFRATEWFLLYDRKSFSTPRMLIYIGYIGTIVSMALMPILFIFIIPTLMTSLSRTLFLTLSLLIGALVLLFVILSMLGESLLLSRLASHTNTDMFTIVVILLILGTVFAIAPLYIWAYIGIRIELLTLEIETLSLFVLFIARILQLLAIHRAIALKMKL